MKSELIHKSIIFYHIRSTKYISKLECHSTTCEVYSYSHCEYRYELYDTSRLRISNIVSSVPSVIASDLYGISVPYK
jgi:hypothetical protein